MSPVVIALRSATGCLVRGGNGDFAAIPTIGLLLALSGFLLAPPAVLGGNTSSVTLPVPGAKATSRLHLTVDMSWVESQGYRPVRVKVSTLPPVPATSDRTLLIELSPNNWGTPNKALTSQFLDLPQGNTTAETTIAVPQIQPWQMMRIDVSEDGVPRPDLSTTASLNATYPGIPNQAFPAILIIDSDVPRQAQRYQQQLMANRWMLAPRVGNSEHSLPDVSLLISLNPLLGGVPASGATKPDDAAILQLVDRSPSLELLPPEELPSRWIDYSCFDLALISLADLRSMQAKHAARWQALRAWVAAGATLCVYGAGERFERLGEFEALLDLSPIGDPQGAGTYRGWTAPDPQKFNASVYADDPSVIAGGPGYGFPSGDAAVMVDEMGQVQPIEPAKPPPQAPSVPTFVFRSINLGRIVALGSEDPFPGEREHWGWLLNSLGTQNWAWAQRHGLSLFENNPDYWNFLIPGVGLAPVTAFRVLITLFVVVIGPVNYFLLRRKRRLYLLLLTVPAGAAMVTSGLLGYALISDGLGVRVRVRSFTEIDQRQGRAVSWSRQSYYAGISPSRGIVFPSETAVYPIRPFAADYNLDHPGVIEWDELGRQNLSSGYMASRVTSQFLVVRSRRDATAELQVMEAADFKSAPQAKNLLGTDIHQLLLVDSAGQPFWATDVLPNESITLQARPIADSLAELRGVFSNNLPMMPDGMNPAYFGGPRSMRQQIYYAQVSGGQTLSLSQASNLLEIHLRECLNLGGRWTEPRTYVAIVRWSPEVPLGTKSAQQQSSFHVIAGRW